MRESIPRQVDEKSAVPKEEKRVWVSQGEDKGLEFSRRRRGQMSFIFSLCSLVLITKKKHFFSLSPELIITQQTTQFQLRSKDYRTILYPA